MTLGYSRIHFPLFPHFKIKNFKNTFYLKLVVSVPLSILYIQILTLLTRSASASGSCEESSRHCTCSMKASVEDLDKIAVTSLRLLSREPEVISQRIQKFQCETFNPLPDALVIKWNDVEDEYRSMIKRRRKRLKRSVRSKSREPRSQFIINVPDLPSLKSFNIPFLNVPLEDFDNEDDDRNKNATNDYNSNREDLRVNGSKRDQNHWRIKEKKSLKRFRRHTALGYPSNDLFGEVIPRLPHRSQHQYVPLGAEAVLPCFGPQEEEEEANPTFDKKFSWTHSNGHQVSASEMTIDKQTGDLTLKAVQLSDSDIYNCEITYVDEDSEESETIVHQHQLDVVAEPIAWLKFSVIYSADKCDHEELGIIKDNLVKWVHQFVCHFCPVRNHSVSCIVNNKDEGPSQAEGSRDIKIRLALSTLGLEHRMASFGSYSEACPLSCVETLHLKLLQIARNSLEKLFSLEIELESPEQEKVSRYSVQGDSMDSDLAIGCPSGFFENYKLCFPCPAGHYSPNGNSICLKCPLGLYQPTPGSGICFVCPTGYGTAGEGSIAEFDCKTEFFVSLLNEASGSNWGSILLILVGIVGPILLIVCLVPWCCPNTFLGRWFAGCSLCAVDPDELPDGNNKPKRNSHEGGDGRGYNYAQIENNEESEGDYREGGSVSERRRAFEEDLGYSKGSGRKNVEGDFGLFKAKKDDKRAKGVANILKGTEQNEGKTGTDEKVHNPKVYFQKVSRWNSSKGEEQKVSTNGMGHNSHKKDVNSKTMSRIGLDSKSKPRVPALPSRSKVTQKRLLNYASLPEMIPKSGDLAQKRSKIGFANEITSRNKTSPMLKTELTQTSKSRFELENEGKNYFSKPKLTSVLTQTSNSKFRLPVELNSKGDSPRVDADPKSKKSVHFVTSRDKTKSYHNIYKGRDDRSDSRGNGINGREGFEKKARGISPMVEKYRKGIGSGEPLRDPSVSTGPMHVKEMAKNLEEEKVRQGTPGEHLHRCMRPSMSKVRQTQIRTNTNDGGGNDNKRFGPLTPPQPPPMPRLS